MKDKETETEQHKDHDEQGKFLPGNKYLSVNAFKKGSSPDRPNKWTVTEAVDIVAEYLQSRLDDGQWITWAGLRLRLGISKEGLDNYRKGEYGKTEEDKKAYVHIFDMFSTVIEDELETELRRKTGQVSGIIFALKNQFHTDWRDEKYLTVDDNKLRTIQVIMPFGSALAKRLEQAGQVDLIEYTPETE